MSVNKIILLGNLGKDAEFKQFENGCIANATLATTDRGYKKQDGTDVQEQTEWHNLVFRGKMAEVARDWCKKGTKVYIEGKVRHRKYTDQQGADKWIYEVIVEKLELLGSKQGEEQQPAQTHTEAQPIYQKPKKTQMLDDAMQLPF